MHAALLRVWAICGASKDARLIPLLQERAHRVAWASATTLAPGESQSSRAGIKRALARPAPEAPKADDEATTTGPAECGCRATGLLRRRASISTGLAGPGPMDEFSTMWTRAFRCRS